jgi:hypothetical protein
MVADQLGKMQVLAQEESSVKATFKHGVNAKVSAEGRTQRSRGFMDSKKSEFSE